MVVKAEVTNGSERTINSSLVSVKGHSRYKDYTDHYSDKIYLIGQLSVISS